MNRKSEPILDDPRWRKIEPIFDSGPGERLTVGLIVLENDMVSELELRTFLQMEGIGIYANRIPQDPRGTLHTLRAMQEHISEVARHILPNDPVSVMVFGCTSGSIAIGPDAVAAAIRAVRPGVQVTNPVTAAGEALRTLGVKRIGLVTPYIDEVNHVVEAHFAEKGFQIVEQASFKVTTEQETRRISPRSIFDAALKIGRADVDGVFISCTALRCSSIIEPLEIEMGKPVVTSNQATAWHCLKLGGCDRDVKGFGRLLSGHS
jgi:maleate isomerase